MLQRWQDNPYLKGKPPKKYVGHVFREQGDPLPGLDLEQRNAVAQQIALKAKTDFERARADLSQLLRSCNVIQLLAHFGFYDQLWLAGSKESAGYVPTEQSSVEWMQALILSIPESELQETLDDPPSGEIVQKINACLNAAQRGFGLMRLGQKQDESGVSRIAEQVRQHTAFVRNEGFPSQTKQVMREIFTPLDAEFLANEGYKLTELSNALWALHALIEKRVNADLQKRKVIFRQRTAPRLIEAFCQQTGEPVDRIREYLGSQVNDFETVRVGLMLALDNGNFRLFYFSDEEFLSCFSRQLSLETIRTILSRLSFEWGVLAKANPDHLILQNPIWTRPLVHVGNHRYLLPIAGLIQSFGLEMIESFIRPQPVLWQKYCNEVRGDYLEDRTEAIMRKAFPDAHVYRGLKWGSNADQQGENDVLLILDTHAIVFECKSGRLRDRASRGDSAALRDEIGKLMNDPAKQAGRFADFLLQQKESIKLQDRSGKWHQIECSGLMRATTVNVVFDYFGPVVTQQLLLRKAGFISADAAPSATIPLHDLECVLEILDQPAVAFHYLRRRAEIESANDIHSDEMGLLATYLATSFDWGEMEGDPQQKLMIAPMAEALTPYFMGKEIEAPVPKPRLRLRAWWKDMLDKFSQRKFPGWIEFSYVLLGVNYTRQGDFERNIRKLIKSVRSNWHKEHDDTCAMISGPKKRKTAVVCVAVKNKGRLESRSVINQGIQLALDKDETTRVLAICMSAGERVHPYLGVYFYAPDLDGRMAKASFKSELIG